jgi:hyaluronoglucosaminidase
LKKINLTLLFLFFFFISPVFSYEFKIIPKPKEILFNGNFFEIPLENLIIVGDENKYFLNELKKFLEESGIKKVDFKKEINFNIPCLIVENIKENPFKEEYKNIKNSQGYKIIVRKIKNNIFIGCIANTEIGIFYSLQTLYQILKKDGSKIVIPEIKIFDYPSFEIRGIIAGSYSEPWSFEDTIDILKFMGKYKMNSFVYGPKGDKLIREEWRKLYSEEQIERFKKEIEEAKKNFIEYGYVISPVKSVNYSQEKSFDALKRKIDQLYEIGIRNFGVFFDDIPEMMTPTDSLYFKEVAEAHVEFTNKLYRYLKGKDKNIRVFFCPIYYSGTQPTPYMKIVRDKLEKEIDIGWTGPDICSYEITEDDAKKFSEIAGKFPGIGDNYPVAGTWGLGPLRNRGKYLYKYSKSYIVNPLGKKPISSQLPLLTIADYAWNSENYEPEESFKNAISIFANNKELEKYLKIFSEHFATSPCRFQKIPEFKKEREKFWEEYINGRIEDSLKNKILEEFDVCIKTKEKLEKIEKNKFYEEMKEPLEKFKNFGIVGKSLFEILDILKIPETKKEREEIKNKVEELLNKIIEEPFRLE